MAVAAATATALVGVVPPAIAVAQDNGGDGGSSSLASENSSTWPPADLDWPPKPDGGGWPPKQDKGGGGGSNQSGGNNSGNGNGGSPSTPIVMPSDQPTHTNTTAPKTNQSANSSDKSKPIVAVNAPPVGMSPSPTSIVPPAQ